MQLSNSLASIGTIRLSSPSSGSAGAVYCYSSMLPKTCSSCARTAEDGAIAVGLPVTRRPPPRARRAVFSRRVLQQDSLLQVGLRREGYLARLGSSNDPWAGHFAALQDHCVALPRVTVALALPVEPLQENPHGAVEERWQAGCVPMDSGVVGIPTEFGIQPLEEP